MTISPTSGTSTTGVARKIPLDDADMMRLDRQSRVAGKRKGGGFILAIVLVVVVIVVLAGVWFYLLKPGDENTPEEAFLDMIDALNRKDAVDYIECTVVHFASQTVKDLEVANMEVYWASYDLPLITVTSVSVIPRDMMPPDAIEPLDEAVAFCESVYHIEVDDSCALEYIMVFTSEDDTESEDGAMMMVEVDSVWYVAIAPFF